MAANVARDAAGNGNEAAEPVTISYDTISDHLLLVSQQWLARFGRTVGSHAMEAIDNRLRESSAGNEVVVGGQPLHHLEDIVRDEDFLVGVVRNDDLLPGSSFHFSGAQGEAPDPGHGDGEDGGAWTVWGEVANTSFAGTTDGVAIDGDGITSLVAVDRASQQWLLGIGLSYSRAEGSFSDDTAVGDAFKGTVTSSLTALHPYVHYQPHERFEVFGTIGYGWGSMDLEGRGADLYSSPITMHMIGLAGRFALPFHSGPALYGKGDLLLVRTQAAEQILGQTVEGEASRSRLALEAVWEHHMPQGGLQSLSVESGLRYDGGDAEQGWGLEIGADWSYRSAERDLTLSLGARGLLVHQEDGAFQEVGWRGSLLYGQEDPLGLSLSLSPSWGHSESGVAQLWGDAQASYLETDGTTAASSLSTAQLQGELGYGFSVFGGHGVLTPYLGMALADTGADWRMGSRLQLEPSLDLSLELRRQGRQSLPPDYGVTLSIDTSW